MFYCNLLLGVQLVTPGACCILKGNTEAVALMNRGCGKGRVTGMSGGSRNSIQNILYDRRISIFSCFLKKGGHEFESKQKVCEE